MTVRDMLELCTDASDIRIRIYDFNSESDIFDSDKIDKDDDAVSEVIFSDMADYEVSSYDLYLHNGVINLELNIDYEPEEDDEEE